MKKLPLSLACWRSLCLLYIYIMCGAAAVASPRGEFVPPVVGVRFPEALTQVAEKADRVRLRAGLASLQQAGVREVVVEIPDSMECKPQTFDRLFTELKRSGCSVWLVLPVASEMDGRLCEAMRKWRRSVVLAGWWLPAASPDLPARLATFRKAFPEARVGIEAAVAAPAREMEVLLLSLQPDLVGIRLSALQAGWISKSNLLEGVPAAILSAQRYLGEWEHVTGRLGLPLYVTDTAYPRNRCYTQPGTYSESRDAFYAAVLHRMQESCMYGGSLAGVFLSAFRVNSQPPNTYSLYASDSVAVQLLREAQPSTASASR